MAGPHDARAVANEVLRSAARTGKTLTVMQLIKLVYVANGWSLALLDRALIGESTEAWRYGPVIPSVYKAFNRFGSSPVTQYAISDFSGLEYKADFDADERRLIDAVVESYGHMHAFQLSNKMHEPGTPWSDTVAATGPNSIIPQELIKKHYLELKTQRNVPIA